MERNDDLTTPAGNAGSLGNSSASAGFGNTGSTTGSAGYGASAGAGYGSTGDAGLDAGQGRVQQAKDAASDKLNQAKDAASSGLSTLKDKASTLNTTIADKLDAGANKLRQAPAAAAGVGGGVAALENNPNMQQFNAKAADALQNTATFLREGDLKATIEEQVRTNPARTLLVALGVGYVLGKALRNNR